MISVRPAALAAGAAVAPPDEEDDAGGAAGAAGVQAVARARLKMTRVVEMRRCGTRGSSQSFERTTRKEISTRDRNLARQHTQLSRSGTTGGAGRGWKTGRRDGKSMTEALRV